MWRWLSTKHKFLYVLLTNSICLTKRRLIHFYYIYEIYALWSGFQICNKLHWNFRNRTILIQKPLFKNKKNICYNRRFSTKGNGFLSLVSILKLERKKSTQNVIKTRSPVLWGLKLWGERSRDSPLPCWSGEELGKASKQIKNSSIED